MKYILQIYNDKMDRNNYIDINGLGYQTRNQMDNWNFCNKKYASKLSLKIVRVYKQYLQLVEGRNYEFYFKIQQWQLKNTKQRK